MDSTAYGIFVEIEAYYDSIEYPKHRNLNFTEFRNQYQQLKNLNGALKSEPRFLRLRAAMSQIVTKIENQKQLMSLPKNEIWSNYSERGMNKVIPVVMKNKGVELPLEWEDRWGNRCSINHGYWSAKNYRVMDALGYMLLLREGGDRLPKDRKPIFNDLYEIDAREHQLNSTGQKFESQTENKTDIVVRERSASRYSVGFTYTDFRKMTGLKLKSKEILQLLLETARVEFKLSFPVRLVSTGAKERVHRMNFFSHLFELGYEDAQVRKDGIVQERRYRVLFNTLLGELVVNNLMAGFNDRIEMHFYTLPESAQVFYRRHLLHNNFPKTELNLSRIAESVGMLGKNRSNLRKAVIRSVLHPLKEAGYIESYSLVDGLADEKVIIVRESKNTNEKERGMGGR